MPIKQKELHLFFENNSHWTSSTLNILAEHLPWTSSSFGDFTFELELNLPAQTMANWITPPSAVLLATFTLIIMKTNKSKERRFNLHFWDHSTTLWTFFGLSIFHQRQGLSTQGRLIRCVSAFVPPTSRVATAEQSSHKQSCPAEWPLASLWPPLTVWDQN